VAVHDGFANGQSEAAAAFGAGTRLVRPVKAFKNMRKIFSRDPLAAIGDG
jgi:hypothetical protein